MTSMHLLTSLSRPSSSFKNEYKLQVKQTAKPCFPVEYLLITLTHGFPVTPSPLFPSSTFPISNRSAGISDQPSMSKVVNSLLPVLKGAAPGDSSRLEDVKPKDVVEPLGRWAGDWHLLEYLAREGGFEEDEMKLLARVAMHHLEPEDALTALKRLWTEPGWQTLLGIAQAGADGTSLLRLFVEPRYSAGV